MPERPRSITIIGRWLMFVGLLNAVAAGTLAALDPSNKLLSSGDHLVWMISAGASLFAGYGILDGKNWGRWLYLSMFVLSIVLGFHPTGAFFVVLFVRSLVFLIAVNYLFLNDRASLWFGTLAY